MSEQLDELVAIANNLRGVNRHSLAHLVKMNRLLQQTEGRLLRSLDLLQQVEVDLQFRSNA